MIQVHMLINGTDHDITKMCDGIEITGSLTSICRQATVTIKIGIYNKTFPHLIFPNNTPLWIKDVDDNGNLKEGLFSGIIIDYTKTAEQYEVIVFDYAYFLKRSKVTKNFNNITAENAVLKILEELGVSAKYLYPSKIIINKLLAQQNAYDSIMDVYTQVSKQTGSKFYLSTSYYNEVGVYLVGYHKCNTLIRPATTHNGSADGNLLSVEYKVTGSNIVNRVKVYDEYNQLVDTLNNEAYSVNEYGVLQEEYVVEEDKDYKTVVQNTLFHGIDKDISVEVLGNYDYYTGSEVKIHVPWIADLGMNSDGTYVSAYITSDTHTWDCSTGAYTTRLELSLNMVMDEKELDDATEGSDDLEDRDEYSSTKVTGASVVKYAKKFLGLPYVYGGTSLETGADCSGFVQAVYEHFGITIGRTTYDQMGNGTEVSTTDKSKWQKGDLIFPHSGHVVMYIGDGKVIHEPKTGDVCKISDVYFDTPVAVRRIINNKKKSKSK